MTTRSTVLTPRIEACLEAGNVENLFPLLSKWPQEELRLLREDLSRAHRLSMESLDRVYREACILPACLANKEAQKMVDHRFQHERIRLAEVFIEIESVVAHYLKDEPEQAEAAG